MKLKKIILFLVLILLSFILINPKIRNYGKIKELKKLEKEKLKKINKNLNNCFDLGNKSDRTTNESINLIEYCMKKYGKT